MTESTMFTREEEVARSCTRMLRLMTGGVVASCFVHAQNEAVLTLLVNSEPGADSAIGLSVPDSVGVVGMVWQTQEAIVIDDLNDVEHFARDVAESTGYVPSRLMATPITHEDGPIGVLEVLDPARELPTDRLLEIGAEMAELLALNLASVGHAISIEDPAVSEAMRIVSTASPATQGQMLGMLRLLGGADS